MKFNIEIDCTPEEARKFLGLPDVSAVQERLMIQVETQMSEALKDVASGRYGRARSDAEGVFGSSSAARMTSNTGFH